MLTCGSHKIYLYYQGKYMSAYYLINSLKNHGFSYFEIRISFLAPLNSVYYKPKKSTEKNLDIYQLIKEKNLLAWHSKASAIREVIILAIQFCMYIKKMI